MCATACYLAITETAQTITIKQEFDSSCTFLDIEELAWRNFGQKDQRRLGPSTLLWGCCIA